VGLKPLHELIAPGGGIVRTGHRGARGLAPENTLPAFRAGVEAGVDVLEFDVQQTKDGQIVVIHDPTVDRTTDGSGLVAEQTLAELRAHDAGYRFSRDGGESFPFRGQGVAIPRLEEVLEAFPEHRFTVELKPSPYPDFVERVVTILRELAPERAVVGAFPHGLLGRFRRLAPEVPTGCSSREITFFYGLHLVGLGGWLGSQARILQIPRFSDHDRDRGIPLTTPRLIRAAHGSGRSVQVWTINEPEIMEQLLDLGVDGITTDRPDLLNEVLARRSAKAE